MEPFPPPDPSAAPVSSPPVPPPPRRFASRPRPPRGSFLVLAAAIFVLLLSVHVRLWSPEFGLTRLLHIGSAYEERGTAAFRATPKFVDAYPPHRWGFDGQFYAEIALDPLLRDPQLQFALDGPVYRARRILLPWLAWLGGLGQPFWILNVCAALNLAFWLGYAWLAVRLFRPHGWPGLAGCAAVLVATGALVSIGHALADFPSAVLLLAAAALTGARRTGLLALAALARESALLGLVAVLDFARPWHLALRRNLLRATLVAAPLAAWTLYVLGRFGFSQFDAGDTNLGAPFGGVLAKLGELSVSLPHGVRWGRWPFELYKSAPLHDLLTVVGLLAQSLYLVLHRDATNRWWRLGAVLVPYFLLIGYATWEAQITRHVLPLTFAFNLLLATRPHRGWLVWFVLGNAFVPFGVHAFLTQPDRAPPPPPPDYALVAPADLTSRLRIDYTSGWSPRQWDARHAWRWTDEQGAALTLINTSSQPVSVTLSFLAHSPVPREFVLAFHGQPLWRRSLRGQPETITAAVVLAPGENVFRFSSPQPGLDLGEPVPGKVSVRVSDLRIEAHR